jgi:tRNA(His) guanylyltransferase
VLVKEPATRRSRFLARAARHPDAAMACSRYEYVKAYEAHDTLLRNTWAIVRLDGRGFTRFTAAHGYAKPNDPRGLAVMNDAARAVLRAFPDIVVAYGQSDEYSFVLGRRAELFGRRREKILSTVVSMFSAEFVRAWGVHFVGGDVGRVELRTTPTFDGRIVVYPGVREVRDYLSWRQADCHVNNLFNSCFWLLVQDGVDKREAEKMLQGTLSADKNELLFSRFGVNYNNEPAMFRKGTCLFRLPTKRLSAAVHESDRDGEDENGDQNETARHGDKDGSRFESLLEVEGNIVTCHEDIIREAFWKLHPHLLEPP